MTNYESIKAMSLEELASMLSSMHYGECECCPMNCADDDCMGTDSDVEQWLQQEESNE